MMNQKQTIERETWIHGLCILQGGETTLCGWSSSADPDLETEDGIPTDEKINCPDCIRIIKHCQTLVYEKKL